MMRSPCPSEEERFAFIDGNLPPEAHERVERHLVGCAHCAEEIRVMHELVGDVHAPFGEELDVPEHVRAVMARLDRPAAAPVARRRAWLLGAASLAGSLALVGYLQLDGRRRAGELQPRGGAAVSSLARDVGVRAFVAEPGLEPLEAGATLAPGRALTGGFRNLGAQTAFFLLFGVDRAGTVHWISPRYERTDDDPVATGLPPTGGERILPLSVVLDAPAPGALRIVALISPHKLHVSDIERLRPEALELEALRRRFPGAEVRETVVFVSGDAGSGP